MTVRGFFAASVFGEEMGFGRRSVVAHYLTFMLKYARRDKIGVPERESGS